MVVKNVIDAKPIPGTQQVLASFSPGHGVNEHAGFATVLSVKQGPDATASAKYLHKKGFQHKRIAALFDVNQGRIAEIVREQLA